MKELYEKFNVSPKMKQEKVVEHICGENGCDVITNTKTTAIFPELSIEKMKEIIKILINNELSIDIKLRNQIVEILEKAKDEI